MIRKVLQSGALASIVLLFGTMAMAQTSEIVASLARLEGRAQVVVGATNRTVQGRNGLLLKAGDTVITKEKSRVTVKFRDGSEVRLFPRSQFVIQATKESKTKERTFSYRLFLKLGSIWGQFVPQRQVASIRMPTATIGIKGTTLRAVYRNKKSRVALTEGRVEVTNQRSKVDLVPGKRLPDFTATDDLTKIVEDIPFKVDIKSEKRKLEFSNNQPEEVFVSLQLIDIKTGAEVHRAGKVYFRSNYGRIAYPPVSNLNQRGFMRVPLIISPPEPTDDKLDGNVYVWAVIDEETADDTAEGKILFTIPVRSGKERIRVESDTGEGKRVR
jgi:hypothetical protein